MQIRLFSYVLILLLTACDKQSDPDDFESGEPSTFIDTSQTKIAGTNKELAGKRKKSDYETVEWTDLMPKEDLDALLNPPEYLDDIEDGSEEDMLGSELNSGKNEERKQTMSATPEEERYQQALVSKEIRPEFDGRHIRIPGFIVPLEFDDQQTITTFFLVPFFGACIHQPPPPPNQIIYAEYEPGFKLDALYDPFWVYGTVSTTLIENDLATAAYSMTVADFEPYTE